MNRASGEEIVALLAAARSARGARCHLSIVLSGPELDGAMLRRLAWERRDG
ncbi:hypothetical protein AB0368_38105 [Actinoplanes sp. NPDC051475]|uniref:hypothetical protein n=1 Tax=Actinoplanes sp. NPDC051475 TaxID=3157225 RepID=UPI003450D980